jgi:hypothetical protein
LQAELSRSQQPLPLASSSSSAGSHNDGRLKPCWLRFRFDQRGHTQHNDHHKACQAQETTSGACSSTTSGNCGSSSRKRSSGQDALFGLQRIWVSLLRTLPPAHLRPACGAGTRVTMGTTCRPPTPASTVQREAKTALKVTSIPSSNFSRLLLLPTALTIPSCPSSPFPPLAAVDAQRRGGGGRGERAGWRGHWL